MQIYLQGTQSQEFSWKLSSFFFKYLFQHILESTFSVNLLGDVIENIMVLAAVMNKQLISYFPIIAFGKKFE